MKCEQKYIHLVQLWGLGRGGGGNDSLCACGCGFECLQLQCSQKKNLETENLVVEHIEVSRAPRGRRRTYRAHGRINAYLSSPCHIQLILREVSKAVEKPKDKTVIRLSKKQMARRRIRVGGGNKA